jgi:signal transduction histidine kinase
MSHLNWLVDGLWQGLHDPAVLFGHFTYFLLIVSSLMRRMVWLRSLAVASGLAKIFYRAVLVVDPVSVLWETVFVVVNLVQLGLIWYYEYHHRFTDEANHFASSMPPGVERSAIKRLLEHAELLRFDAGEVLTRFGEPVAQLMYLAEGVVKIESGDRIVAVLGPGDYLGELSFLSGNPATATATVVKPVRILAFNQAELREAIVADPQLRRTLDSALNRNLAGKLARSNTPNLALERL